MTDTGISGNAVPSTMGALCAKADESNGGYLGIRVLLADDQAIIRDLMHKVLIRQPGVVSVVLADGGAQAIDLSRTTRLDVVVLDVAMPAVNGIAALTTLQRERPKLPVVMLSTSTDAYTVRNCMQLGALGYVGKESAFEELLTAIRVVLTGQTYLCRVVRDALVMQSV